MLLVHLFVCFVRVSFCPFSLPLGVEGWLRFVIVAYPDLSINFFGHEKFYPKLFGQVLQSSDNMLCKNFKFWVTDYKKYMVSQVGKCCIIAYQKMLGVPLNILSSVDLCIIL